MEKGIPPGIFVNDGSFMEKFKQLQQQNPTDRTTTRSAIDTFDTPPSLESGSLSSKKTVGIKISDTKKSGSSSLGGKLAFSLKQKSKVAAPAVKLAEDDEDEERSTESQSNEETTKRQKISQTGFSGSSHNQGSFAPSPPSNSAVKNVADKLASFVAKSGRQFEDITRQKNPGDTPFKFLFDTSCPDYKYYEYRLLEEEKALGQTKDSHSSYIVSNSTPTQKSPSGSQRSNSAQHPNYQTPASTLYETRGETSPQSSSAGESSAPSASDPIAMMEFYMKKAAQEERKRQPRYSKDEMPPPASLQVPVKKGHHMGDYIPQEELDKFLSSCNDAAAQKAAKEAAERAKIQADNVGHKLLSKMGWKEGEGLGSSKSGRADPVMAGNVKLNNLGVGAEHPGEVTPEDDIYEQYKKRMMLGYRHRPNPLNNPRKAYY